MDCNQPLGQEWGKRTQNKEYDTCSKGNISLQIWSQFRFYKSTYGDCMVSGCEMHFKNLWKTIVQPKPREAKRPVQGHAANGSEGQAVR